MASAMASGVCPLATCRTIRSRPRGVSRAFLCTFIRSSESLKSQQPQRPRSGPDGQPTESSQLALIAVAQAIETLLHLFHLALEIVDVAAGLRLLVGVAALALARERREHRKGALEHFHVPAHLLFDRAEAAHTERLRNLLAELLLLASERINRDFQVARHQHLHAVAVE